MGWLASTRPCGELSSSNVHSPPPLYQLRVMLTNKHRRPNLHNNPPDRQNRFPSKRRRNKPQAPRERVHTGRHGPNCPDRFPLRNRLRLLCRKVVRILPTHDSLDVGFRWPPGGRGVSAHHCLDIPQRRRC